MMNYCATHNQFYSTHCVYCGPPPIRITTNTTGTISTSYSCANCGQLVFNGMMHVCSTASK
jgi:hypothetical protein